MYAKWENGLLVVSDSEQDGYKPMVNTEKPIAEEGYEALFFWRKTDDSFVQTWEIVEVVDEVDETEAFDIIFGGAE